jgi:hypothetical protein
MSFHLMAFTQKPEDMWEQSPLTPAPDLVTALSENGHPIFSQELKIIAGYAVGDALSGVHVEVPRLRGGATPSIVPIEITGWEENQHTPNLMVLHPRPWTILKNEELVVNAENVQGFLPNSPTVALLWLADQVDPVPEGPNYWIRYHAKAGYAGEAFPGWFPLEVTFDDRLAKGEYAVVGFEHRGDNVVAARLVFNGQMFRPGTLAVAPAGPHAYGSTAVSPRPPTAFLDGSLGVYGTFPSFLMPRVEVHLRRPSAPGPSPSEHEGYLRLIRLR